MMASLASPLGVFGGTFNPPHYGHLCPLEEAAKECGIDKVLLMPCQLPPHKAEPNVSAELRLHMVELACQHFSCFEASDVELRRPGPSYTVDMLTQLRATHPNTPLCFFLGLDSLLHLDSWHRWQDIISLAHIVVSMRPGWEPQYNARIRRLLEVHQTNAAADLHNAVAGSLYFAETTPVHVSSTQIRQRLNDAQNVHGMMPEQVSEFVAQHV